jgi:hypothetical protein
MADGKNDWVRYIPDVTPGYADPVLSTYRLKDAIGTEEYPSEMFFAPSLVELIKNAPNQELGSHTFSHYYVNEAGTTPEAFLADLAAARKIAEEKGCPSPRAIIFPKNQINAGALALLGEAGFTVYRGEEGNWIHQKINNVQFQRALRLLNNYLPVTGSDSFTLEEPNIPGVYNVKASRFFRPYGKRLAFLEPLKLRRIKGQMRRAAKKREIYHLWWHPHNFGKNTDINLHEAEELFAYYKKLNAEYGMLSATMSEVCLLGRQNAAAPSGTESRSAK